MGQGLTKQGALIPDQQTLWDRHRAPFERSCEEEANRDKSEPEVPGTEAITESVILKVTLGVREGMAPLGPVQPKATSWGEHQAGCVCWGQHNVVMKWM